MNLNFELVLFYLIIISGLLALYDKIFNARIRAITQKKMHWVFDYAYSFFPILLIVFLLRSFWFEPFRIPSPSLEPTLLIGDFIAVNKFYYGIRLPVTHQKIFNWHEPTRGDILIFRWPPAPQFDFIKRVIGVPGDHVSYVNRVLKINGHEIPEETIKNTQMIDAMDLTANVVEKREDLFGIRHAIYVIPNSVTYDFNDIIVPKDMYFVLGDNRDASMDSRYWGFVPEQNIVGKASFVWMSWDSTDATGTWTDRLYRLTHFWKYIRWKHIFTALH